jgi:hypothetical protein
MGNDLTVVNAARVLLILIPQGLTERGDPCQMSTSIKCKL